MASSRSSEETASTAGVAVPPPVLYVTALVIGIALDSVLPTFELPRAVRWSVGGVLVSGGVALAAAFFRAFRRAGTPVDLRKPTASLVTTGPFRFTRNPGYLSLTILATGLAVAAGTPWALVTVAVTVVIVDRAVIRREERYLEGRFGDDYQRYLQRTRRWL